MNRRKKTVLIMAPILVVLCLGAAWFLARPKAAATGRGESYEYTTVNRGTIESVVSSSGTLAPVSEVSVPSQMSGRVEKVNATYNDRVTKGQVLVELNTDTLKLQELSAQSAVAKAQASCNLQLLDYQNKSELAKKGLLADYDLKASKTTLDVSAAELASAQSALKVIQIQLNQYALITAPISGIVLDRNVEVGQSVVEGSSSNATSLFTLAEDLASMQIKAAVDELDIGSIKVGQEVRFTVEASPGTTYTGAVKEIRLVPATSNNVVNYYVIISAPNKNARLLPGMTADIEFIKQKKTNVLVVPTAALRFTPTGLTAAEVARAEYLAGLDGLDAGQKALAAQEYDEQQKTAASGKSATGTKSLTSLLGGGMGGPGGGPGGSGGGPGGAPGGGPGGAAGSSGSAGSRSASASGSASSSNAAKTAGTEASADVVKYLWYVDADGRLAALRVTVGASDGTNTEISSAEDLAGRKIILKIKVG
jgi:HlyD family secretion protein